MILQKAISAALAFCLAHACFAGAPEASKMALEIEDTVAAYLDAGYELRIAMRGASSLATADGEFSVVNEKGRVAARGGLKDGKLDGDFLIYADDGRILVLSRFQNGKAIGDTVSWDSNGSIYEITRYDNEGKKHGNQTVFRDGLAFIEIIWEHGNPLEVRLHGTENKILKGTEVTNWFKQRAALRSKTAPVAP